MPHSPVLRGKASCLCVDLSPHLMPHEPGQHATEQLAARIQADMSQGIGGLGWAPTNAGPLRQISLMQHILVGGWTCTVHSGPATSVTLID